MAKQKQQEEQVEEQARQEEAQQHRERGGLAGTVAAEKRRRGTARHDKAQRGDRRGLVEALGQIADQDRGRERRLHHGGTMGQRAAPGHFLAVCSAG